jgi:hypothetical protein
MKQIFGNRFTLVVEQIIRLFAQEPDYGIRPFFHFCLRHFYAPYLIPEPCSKDNTKSFGWVDSERFDMAGISFCRQRF